MDLSFMKNKNFVKKYLLITVIVGITGIAMDLLGFLQVLVVQMISVIIIIVAFAVLIVLSQLIFINVDGKEKTGSRIKMLAHGLTLLLAFIPLLIGMLGALSSIGIYFLMPVTADASSLGVILSVFIMCLVLGYGIILSVYCYNNLEETQIWKF